MNILTSIREEMLIPIHPAGWPFIGLFGVLTWCWVFHLTFFLDWCQRRFGVSIFSQS